MKGIIILSSHDDNMKTGKEVREAEKGEVCWFD